MIPEDVSCVCHGNEVLSPIPGELWKGSWGLLAPVASYKCVEGRWQPGWVWMHSTVTTPAWLQGGLSFQLKPTQITSSTGPTTSLWQPVRAQ